MRCPILRTIIYFDLFNWPLRAEEIWKWIYLPKCNPKINQISYVLKNKSSLQAVLKEKDGFYFLKKDENLTEGRLKKFRLAEKKYKKAFRFIKIISFFPFIKMIAICNDLGYSNAPKSSDIDLFIITSKNRIWSARFLITGFLKFFKLRPGEKSEDAICPSFFIDKNNLNLEKLTLKNNNKIDDPHFIFWINQMTPILDKNKTYEKFRNENKWVKKFLPNIYNYNNIERRKIIKTKNNFIEIILENSMGDWLEKKAKKIQIKIMPKELKNRANNNTNIVITDGILKFHKNDTRKNIREKFYEKLLQNN